MTLSTLLTPTPLPAARAGSLPGTHLPTILLNTSTHLLFFLSLCMWQRVEVAFSLSRAHAMQLNGQPDAQAIQRYVTLFTTPQTPEPQSKRTHRERVEGRRGEERRAPRTWNHSEVSNKQPTKREQKTATTKKHIFPRRSMKRRIGRRTKKKIIEERRTQQRAGTGVEEIQPLRDSVGHRHTHAYTQTHRHTDGHRCRC